MRVNTRKGLDKVMMKKKDNGLAIRLWDITGRIEKIEY